MPNIASAKKRVRQTKKNHTRNLARKSAIKTAVKLVISAVDENNVEKARTLLRAAQAKLGRARSKGVLHANTASRKLGRIAKRVAQIEKGSQIR